MGVCFSSPADKYESDKLRRSESSEKAVPDVGIAATHDIIKLLGKGAEGEAWLCRERATGQEVAIKLIKRPIPKPTVAFVKQEVEVEADLGQGHVNIVSAQELILTKSHLGLVMEYIPGGNMVTYVIEKAKSKVDPGGLCMDEDEARYFFIQIISAIEHCHKHHVAHRDLKLDNVLVDNRDPPRAKLCDFGFAKHWLASSNMQTLRIGTPVYMGPELINATTRSGYDGKKVDVWAAGVLLYAMLVGMFPFEATDEDLTAELVDILTQQMSMNWRDLPNNSAEVEKLSPELCDLLDKLFEVNQDLRPDVAAIKNHQWVKKPLPAKFAKALEELQEEQRIIDDQAAKGLLNIPERHDALQLVVERAATPAQPGEDIARVRLSRVRGCQNARTEPQQAVTAVGQA